MPYYTDTAPITRAALELLSDRDRRETMRKDLEAVVRSLGTRRAAEETARIALAMIDRTG
jgi:hypothetical protein